LPQNGYRVGIAGREGVVSYSTKRDIQHFVTDFEPHGVLGDTVRPKRKG
jgi:hypothetical protein